MNYFLNLPYQLSTWLLIGFFLFLVFLSLKLAFKGVFKFAVPFSIIVFGVFITTDLLKYTTFQQLNPEISKEDSEIHSITIYINDLSESLSYREARLIIEDPETIEKISNDLAAIRLKDTNSFHDLKYSIDISYSYQIEENMISRQSFLFHIDEQYLFRHEIVNDTNHLETIETLVDSDDAEWEELERIE